MFSALCSLIILAGVLLPLSARGAEMVWSKDDVGQLWLQIIGRIDDDDDAKFKSMLIGAINRGEQITNVSIYSQGGQWSSAIKIGRYIRTMHLTTVAPQLVPLLGRRNCALYATNGRMTVLEYDPVRHQGDPRCTCARECLLIWVAGTIRVGNAVQIHPVSSQEDDDGKLPVEQASYVDAASRAIIDGYLQEMGVPEVMTERMFNISSDKIEYLTKEERDVLSRRTDHALFSSRCALHAATSPAALACENAVTRELYWQGARQITHRND
jgi:hypothetical protein